MANISVNNISVPRIARNGRIYAGNVSSVKTTQQSNPTVLDWVSVSDDLVAIDRSLSIDGDLTVQNLAGNSGDTVIVDDNGTLATVRPVSQEVPSGTIDNVNTVFTLAHIPVENTDRLMINGLRLKRGVDYTISDDTITFTNPPYTDAGYTDVILCDYYYLTYSSGGDVPTAASVPYTTMTRGAAASATGYDIKASRVGRTITVSIKYISIANPVEGTVIAYLPVATIAEGLTLSTKIYGGYREVSSSETNRGINFYIKEFDPVVNTNMELIAGYEYDSDGDYIYATLTFNVI